MKPVYGPEECFQGRLFFGSTVVGLDCFWRKISLICEAGNLQYVFLYMQRVLAQVLSQHKFCEIYRCSGRKLSLSIKLICLPVKLSYHIVSKIMYRDGRKYVSSYAKKHFFSSLF